jgi:hypothetical protein
MSAFNAATEFTPTSIQVDPPNRPDQLAEAVLASLSRGRSGYRGRPWGLLKTAILSFFSMGILPLLIWPKRFRDFMKVEQQQLLMLADWLKLRTGRAEAAELRDQAAAKLDSTAQSEPVHVAVLMLAALALFSVLTAQNFDAVGLWYTSWNPGPYGRHGHSFIGIWTILLTAGYFVHWLGVCRHAAALEDYVAKFNAITSTEGVPPVRVPSVGLGIEPLWIVAALIGLSRGCLWAIPLSLAGVVQARYVLVTSRRTRGELARRVKSMLLSSRPALAVRSTPRPPSTQCLNEKCRAPVRLGAAFCPRCGSHSA